MRGNRIFPILAFLWIALPLLFASSAFGEGYEAYYRYLSNRPNDMTPGWHNNAQGLTHDLTHWFITQEAVIWKIPMEYDLEYDVDTTNSTREPMFSIMPTLYWQGYNHFGDLAHYQNVIVDGEGNILHDAGYLVIPITGKDENDEDLIPVIAVLRASDLTYVGHDTLKYGEIGSGWCAVDPKGFVYTSGSGSHEYYQYTLRWDLLPQNTVVIEHMGPQGHIPFLDEQGDQIQLHHLQGGVFSQDGRYLYIVSGYYDEHVENDGINVFDTLTKRRVQRSKNGYGLFNYEFHPGWYDLEILNEEPEGITIWDLDDKGPDTIRGQMHVIMLNNDWPDDDNVYIKHYTNKTFVDAAFSGSGTISDPFQMVIQANDFAWDGSEIHIKGGNYPETLTFSKRVRVVAHDGTVTIGQ